MILKNLTPHATPIPISTPGSLRSHVAPFRIEKKRVSRRYQPYTRRRTVDEHPRHQAAHTPNRSPEPPRIPSDSPTKNGDDVATIHPNPRPPPPHPSIYEKPHPDPTAGGVLRWETTNERARPLYDAMWFNKRVFEKGEWLGMEGLSERARDDFFKQENPGIPWKNLREYRRDVARLPHGPSWYRCFIPLPTGGFADMHARNPLDIIRQLMGNRRFKNHIRYSPVQQRAGGPDGQRLYGEVWSADRWWQLQNALGLGRGATIATVILSSDKTQLSVMCGNKKAWPVYITLGNIESSIRRRPSEHATVLLGYVPVTDLTGEDAWQFFHDCVERMLQPLKEAGRTGVEMRCADGGVRLVFPLVVAYIADFPEQCLVACARESRCPKCLTPTEGRGELDHQHPPRDRATVLSAMNLTGRERAHTMKSLGIRPPTEPFWRDLPFADISSALTPDLLHQLHKGVFGEHLTKWFTDAGLLGDKCFDHWLMGIPRAAGLRHFSKGKSAVKQWTGKEMKALAQVFMSIAAGCSEEDAVRAARYLLNFLYRAHLPLMSDEDLQDLENDLAGFHALKAIFLETGCLDSEEGPTKDGFDGIPKIHMLCHYAHVVRELGATSNFNTEATERLHIEYVKSAWRATNHRDEIPQMAEYLRRREAWVLLRSYLSETGHLASDNKDVDSNDCADEIVGETTGPSDQQDGGKFEVLRGEDEEDVAGAHAWSKNAIWYPKPKVSTAGDRTHLKRDGAYLIENHGATHLIGATQDFLELHTTSRSRRPLHNKHVFEVWPRCRLEHGRVPLLPTDPAFIENIRASPELTDEHGQVTRYTAFDTILFDSHPDRHGLRRYTPGRIRVIFKLPRHLRFLYPHKLAYVEHFHPLSTMPNEKSGFFTTRIRNEVDQAGVRRVSVIPLSKIRMACHLTPIYRFKDDFSAISTESDTLSTYSNFYLNNYGSYFMFNLLVHWERRLQGDNS